jgi:hypothetical protein
LIMAAFARHLPRSLELPDRGPVHVAALAPRAPGPQVDVPAPGGPGGSPTNSDRDPRAGVAVRGRTRPGVTGGSTASWSPSATRCQRRRSGTS